MKRYSSDGEAPARPVGVGARVGAHINAQIRRQRAVHAMRGREDEVGAASRVFNEHGATGVGAEVLQ